LLASQKKKSRTQTQKRRNERISTAIEDDIFLNLTNPLTDREEHRLSRYCSRAWREERENREMTEKRRAYRKHILQQSPELSKETESEEPITLAPENLENASEPLTPNLEIDRQAMQNIAIQAQADLAKILILEETAKDLDDLDDLYEIENEVQEILQQIESYTQRYITNSQQNGEEAQEPVFGIQEVISEAQASLTRITSIIDQLTQYANFQSDEYEKTAPSRSRKKSSSYKRAIKRTASAQDRRRPGAKSQQAKKTSLQTGHKKDRKKLNNLLNSSGSFSKKLSDIIEYFSRLDDLQVSDFLPVLDLIEETHLQYKQSASRTLQEMVEMLDNLFQTEQEISFSELNLVLSSLMDIPTSVNVNNMLKSIVALKPEFGYRANEYDTPLRGLWKHRCHRTATILANILFSKFEKGIATAKIIPTHTTITQLYYIWGRPMPEGLENRIDKYHKQAQIKKQEDSPAEWKREVEVEQAAQKFLSSLSFFPYNVTSGETVLGVHCDIIVKVNRSEKFGYISKFNLELDGNFHTRARSIERDKMRDTLLKNHEIPTVRMSASTSIRYPSEILKAIDAKFNTSFFHQWKNSQKN